ncbi:MAG TPA: SHOCT domain-containing protein [Candidatus Binatus sp.]|nr:SHOCT domain-containing protein [Candidatus Binatus sp.]
MRYGFGLDYLGWGGVIALLVMVLFWVLVVVLIVLGIRWLIRADRNSRLGGPGAGPRPDDPLEILRQRYARGEIDEEEYARRRRTLTGG